MRAEAWKEALDVQVVRLHTGGLQVVRLRTGGPLTQGNQNTHRGLSLIRRTTVCTVSGVIMVSYPCTVCG